MAWREISARYLNLKQHEAESKLKEKGFAISKRVMSQDDAQVNYYHIDGKHVAIYDIANFELIILVEKNDDCAKGLAWEY